jgi:hypothetical protein
MLVKIVDFVEEDDFSGSLVVKAVEVCGTAVVVAVEQLLKCRLGELERRQFKERRFHWNNTRASSVESRAPGALERWIPLEELQERRLKLEERRRRFHWRSFHNVSWESFRGVDSRFQSSRSTGFDCNRW